MTPPLPPHPPRSSHFSLPTLSTTTSSLSLSQLILTLLTPLLPLLETAHRLLLNTLALILLISTLPFSLYLKWGQTPRIARGEGLIGHWIKEWSGILWEGFDWLEECEDEGVLREWIERKLGIQGQQDGQQDDVATHSTSAFTTGTGTFKRGRRQTSHTPTTTITSSSSSPAATARRDSGIELVH